MHHIVYRPFRSEYIDQVCAVYQENGWTNYLDNRTKLIRAFRQSLYIVGAFCDDELVGFIRCVGDGEYILYIQDLIIRPAYHRQGIGTALIRQLFTHYPDIRQSLLVTDTNDSVSNAFYASIGMSTNCNGYPVTHYFRVWE